MSNQLMRLDEQAVRWAALGGSILGGGGGGSAVTGTRTGNLATQFSELYLTPISQIDPEVIVVTASMVGAPAAKEKYVAPADVMRCVELFKRSTGLEIGGIVTNENGGGSTFNGWLEASLLGLPLLDAPCNGRAHPTGVMGSLNLHKNPGYVTTMTCVGGRKETGRYVECTVTGSISHCSKLVRAAAVEAGGLVAVIRNPVKAGYLQQNCAVGGLSQAIETGQVYEEGLEQSVEHAVHAVADFLGGEVLTRGTVSDYLSHGVGVPSGSSVNCCCSTRWMCHTFSFGLPVWKYLICPVVFKSSFALRSVRKLYPAAFALSSSSFDGILPPASSNADNTHSLQSSRFGADTLAAISWAYSRSRFQLVPSAWAWPLLSIVNNNVSCKVV